MLRVKPEYYSDVEKKLRDFFYQEYFAPILEEMKPGTVALKNSVTPVLIAAIQSERVKYKDGVFSGSYNVAISKEISQFARFDKRSKTWMGRPPADVLAASIQAEGKRKYLIDAINKKIDAMSSHVEETIRTLSFGADLPLFAMNQDIVSDLPGIGVKPEIDERTASCLRKDYTESQTLNVKGWDSEQVTRLRDAVERYQTTDTKEALIDIIQREWQVSANKANFLARQETSLFFSKLAMNRAAVAGVRRYRWSTSHDERVRESHKELNGTIHSVDDPPIVDARTGRRGHPGEDFGCRCAAIWVLE